MTTDDRRKTPSFPLEYDPGLFNKVNKVCSISEKKRKCALKFKTDSLNLSTRKQHFEIAIHYVNHPNRQTNKSVSNTHADGESAHIAGSNVLQ